MVRWLQLASMFDTEQTIESYNSPHRAARRLLLIAICCQTGAILSDASPEEVDAFYRFGHHLGMAFQIKDDMLDLLPVDDKIGKPIGHDLESGLINLPTILLLQKDFPEKAEIVSRIPRTLPKRQGRF